MKKRLIKRVQDTIEKIRLKQLKKRELKSLSKQVRSAHPDEAIDYQADPNLVPREVLIRLKPFTESSKEFVAKERRKNSLLQFRLTVLVPGGNQGETEARKPPSLPVSHTSTNKTVKDIIKFICEKWSLRQRQIELRLCQSAADLVIQDPRNLIKYDKQNSSSVKITDLIPKNFLQSQEDCTLYLLYEIKRMDDNDVSDTDEDEEENPECSDDVESDEESSER